MSVPARVPAPRRQSRRAAVGLTLCLLASLLPADPLAASPPASSRETPLATPATPLHALSASAPVRMADGVALTSNQANGLRLIDDDTWALANVRYQGQAQVGAVRLAEPGFSCVTCGVLDGAREASPFADGERAFVAKSEGGTGDIQFFVVRCSPALTDCRDRSVKPVTLPRDGLDEGVQNREPRVAPDGQHLAWTEVSATAGPVMVIGDLRETATEYVVRQPYVLNPRYHLDRDAAAWVPGTRYYETGGGWLDGGRTLVYRSTSTSMNYDIFELDLATGRRTRVTRDLDYNEIYEGSPDGKSALYASARGLDRMDVFTQLRRPAFLDTFTFPQLGRISLHNNRRCMNEHWLMRRSGQRAQYAGQPLVLRDNWVIRGSDWFEDGHRILITEQPFTPEAGTPAAGEERVELRIVAIAGQEPGRPERPVDLDSIDYASWAVPYGTYRAPGDRPVQARIVRGKESGRAVITYAGTFAAGAWSVTYRNYSDDGRTFLSGTESITTPAAPVQATWTADLTSRGERHGFMRGVLEIHAPAQFSGMVQTRVNGRTWRGVPTQAKACPGVHRPALRVVDSVTRDGVTRIRIGARVPEAPAFSPVARARVQTRSGTVHANNRGWAELPPGAGAGTVRITAGGFRPWEGRLRRP